MNERTPFPFRMGILLILVLSCGRARADLIYWKTTDGSGDFSRGADWVSGVMPGEADIASWTNAKPSAYSVNFSASVTTATAQVERDAVAWALNGHTYTVTNMGYVGAIQTGGAELTITGGVVQVLRDFYVTYNTGINPAHANYGYLHNNGTLEIELGGTEPATQYDQLAILGEIKPLTNGTLAVRLLDGYQPPLGETSYDVMTLNGDFDSSDLTALSIVYPELRNTIWSAAVADTTAGGQALRITARVQPAGSLILIQ